MEAINVDEWMTQNESLFAGDKNLLVEFFLYPVRNPLRSDQEGRSIFEDREYIRIQVPGQRLSIIERPVREVDKQRFADRYNRWKSGTDHADTGTPLESVNWLMPSTKEEYAFFKVKTIEALAECPDNIPIPTLQGDKRRAKAFVAAMRENAPIVEMKKANAELLERIEALEGKAEESVSVPIADDGEEPKRKHGRPTKDKE